VSQHMKQSSQGDLPLVIGQGMIIKGSIHSERDVFVYGEVEGELDVENCTLTIGPHGKVVASARAREVEIQGIITGDVETSGTTSIRHTGQLIGDVRTGGIVVEAGAVLKGAVEIVTRSERRPEAANGE
jgi:cytoskeletal protein CcmA (bactofilin family)